MSRTRQVEINSDGRVTEVMIEGTDVTNLLTGIRFEIGSKYQMPKVVLEGGASGGLNYSGPALVELASPPEEGAEHVIEAEALAIWLEQQAEDDSLVQVMAKGSLDGSPVTAVMNELIRRARE